MGREVPLVPAPHGGFHLRAGEPDVMRSMDVSSLARIYRLLKVVRSIAC
jgi:hypothetical protein